jgi:hypothetical protein
MLEQEAFQLPQAQGAQIFRNLHARRRRRSEVRGLLSKAWFGSYPASHPPREQPCNRYCSNKHTL